MNDIAPEGSIFVCTACGKTSKTRYGFYSDGTPAGVDTMPDGSRVSAVPKLGSSAHDW